MALLDKTPVLVPMSPPAEHVKPSKGVFKTKRITIRRSKDPHTFKCSVCDTGASTLRELNAHYIGNHQNVNCDICGKAFSTPGSLCKHHYTHAEEGLQFKCRSCDKIFTFESQLKSHRHMHRRNCNYICASANCGKSFGRPGDLVSRARSCGKPFSCTHCTYSNLTSGTYVHIYVYIPGKHHLSVNCVEKHLCIVANW